ncbi:MAG: 2-C-methyl-D-erythritol 2,4-cyclodiphosphate synthase [Thermodesulfatator sp.]|nr:MAG: 2-C-methyl-D-erythritol 2,4-cyclodiphosphate synthase [Thermodesulfatator sp.]
MKVDSRDFRTGFGYDVHRLVEGRKLVLGGVEIPYELGLLGHSDADVLLHAVCDALLGAAGLGDIGRHFPDFDPSYRGISSMTLLKEVNFKLASSNWKTNNVDSTIVAQRPKLSPFIPKMVSNISECLGIALDRVNVKATTTEGLGFAGQGQGIAAYSVVTVVGI